MKIKEINSMWYQEILAEIVVTLMVPIIVWILTKLRNKKPRFILKTIVVINAILQTFFMIELPERIKYPDQFTIRAIIVFLIMITVSYMVAFKRDKSQLKKKVWRLPKFKRTKKVRTKKQPKIYRSKKSRRNRKEEF